MVCDGDKRPLEPRVDGGRDAKTGRFVGGNKLGKGNPLAGRAAKIRAELLRVVSPAAARRLAKKLLERAQSGDLAAIRELLDRTVGKPVSADVEDRLDALESLLTEDRRL